MGSTSSSISATLLADAGLSTVDVAFVGVEVFNLLVSTSKSNVAVLGS